MPEASRARCWVDTSDFVERLHGLAVELSVMEIVKASADCDTKRGPTVSCDEQSDYAQ